MALRFLTPVVVALALVAAGCGGKKSSAPTTTTTETVTQQTSTEAAGTGTGTTDLSKLLGDKDCQALLAAGASFAQAFSGTGSGSSTDSAKAFQNLASKVPDAIKADVNTLAQWYSDYAAKLQKIGIKPGQTPTADQLQQLQAALSTSATQDVQKASTHLSAWAKKNCTG